MEDLLLIALSALICGAAIMVQSRREKDDIRRWKRNAALHDLEPDSKEPVVRGNFDGIDAVATLYWTGAKNSRRLQTRLEAEFRRPPASGLEVRYETAGDVIMELARGPDVQLGEPRLDRLLHVKADDPEEVRALLGAPEVVNALRAVLPYAKGLQLRTQTLSFYEDDVLTDLLRHRLGAAADVVRAIERQAVAPWRAAAKRWGLSLDADSLHLEGLAEGVAFEVGVRQVRDEPALQIRGQVDLPLPEDLRVMRREPGNSGLRLGDPILDSLLVVSARSPDAARRLLLHSEVRGPLLAVVHGFPGSTLVGRQIILRRPGRAAGDLSDRIGDVVELCAVLALAVEGAQEPGEEGTS